MLRKWLKFFIYMFVATTILPAHAQDDVAFFRAVNLDSERGVRDWLAAGGDPNRADSRGQTALILAMRDESFKVAALLLDHPATRVDATNNAGETALMMAALKGHLAWVQRLAARGAALRREGWTPLHYAASGGGVDVVRWLLDQGVPIDAPAPNRSTPLMMAARYGASESVELLLARGADPRPRNDRGMDASDFARGAGRDGMAERLTALAAAAPRP
ncbi:MAG: ankyrin repeat domain-containing protein [Rubrivivax sp.]